MLKKLGLKLAGRQMMKSSTIKRWVPLLAVTAYVVAAVLRVLGEVTQAQQIEDVVKALGLPVEIEPAEIAVAIGAGAGLAIKYTRIIRKALGYSVTDEPPVLKTQAEHESFIARYQKLVSIGVPWEDARRTALQQVLDVRNVLDQRGLPPERS